MQQIEASLHAGEAKIAADHREPPPGLTGEEEVEWWKRRVSELSSDVASTSESKSSGVSGAAESKSAKGYR
jgi:hypothetical protein